MGWLRLVGSLKRQVSFAKEPYKRDHILQKRLIVLRSLLIVATAYVHALVVQGTTVCCCGERWGAGVETQKNVRGEIRGWGRVPFNEPYAPSLSTIYDGA